MAVAQDLNFNVPWFLYKFFNEHAIIAKRVKGFVFAGRKTFKGFFVVGCHAQAFATAACRGFDHDGVAYAFGNFDRGFCRVNGIVVTRNGVDLGFVGQLLRRNFVAHGGNGKVTWADEGNALVFTAFRKCFVFRQEAVAWVNGLCACSFGRGNDFVGHQIRLARWRWANQHSFVGQQHMTGFFVGFRVNGNGGDAHFLGGGNDAACNFTAVGYQNFGKHIFS